jgi:hypothetical protein
VNCDLPQVGVFTNLLTAATYAKFVVGFFSVGENTDSGQGGRAERLELSALSRGTPGTVNCKLKTLLLVACLF